MSPSKSDPYHRILVISQSASLADSVRGALSTEGYADTSRRRFTVDGATNEQEGMRRAQNAKIEGRPYSIVFVDGDAFSGDAGPEPVTRLWAVQPSLQIILCTPPLTCAWDELLHRVGQSDRLVILKKPLEELEVRQLVQALCARIRAEDGLSQSEARQRLQIENSQAAIIIWDASFAIMRANPAAVELFDVDNEGDLVSLTLPNLLLSAANAGETPPATTEIADRLAKQGACSFEWALQRPGGTAFDAAVTLTRMDLPGHTLIHSAVRDISQCKVRERALKQSEESYRTLLDASPDALVITDPGGLILSGSARTSEMFGAASIDELIGTNVLDWVAPEESELAGASLQRLLLESPALNVEHTLVRVDGTRFVAEINASAFHFEDDRPKGTILIVRDITARKNREVDLQRTLSRLQTALHSTADGILVVDSAARITVANRRFADLFKVPQAMLEVGDDQPVLRHVQQQAKNPAAFLSRVYEIYAHPNADSFDHVELADGRTIERYSSTQWVDQCPVGRVWSFRDITQRKQTEKALQEQTLLLEAMLNAIPAPVFYKDVEGIYLNCNAAFLELLRLPRSAVIGKTVVDITTESLAAQARKIDFELFQSGGAVSYESKHVRPDGSECDVIFNKAVFQKVDGTPAGIVAVMLDITERKQAEDRVRVSSEREKMLWQAVDQSPASVMVTDANACIQYVNPKFTEVTGYTIDEVRGKNPRVLRSGKIPPEIYKQLWSKISSGENWRGHFCNRKKNGDLFWESALILPIKDEHDAVVQYLALKEDITEIKRAEEALRASNQRFKRATARAKQLMVKAEAASLAKSQFLANMSHELRTPMNGVIGMSRLLLDTSLTAEQRKYVDVVCSSSESLMGLLNDILDFSKIEARKLTLETVDFDLHHTLQEAADILAIKAHDKGLEMICQIEPDVPVLMKGDAGRLFQIVVNLAGNAVKFTERGQVCIHASLQENCGAQHAVRISVTDTGIGITTDGLKALFKPFTQVDGSTTRHYGGTGLGLAISKELVGMMGGTIGVDTEEGKGACFWFTVPFEKSRLAPAPIASVAQPLQDINVLVVDDNRATRDMVSELLQRWGCHTAQAADGYSAINVLRRAARNGTGFHIALLDLEMPEIDGMRLADLINGDPVIRSTHLVLLRPFGQPAERGYYGYVHKPIHPAQLLDCLERVIKGPIKMEKILQLKDAEGDEAAGMRRSLPILVVEDHPMNQLVIEEILKKLGYRFFTAVNGKQALQTLRENSFQLVLMDCQMPEMDGFEVTQRIRQGEAGELNSRLSIIALTAHALVGDRERCLKSGMDDYVAKPVHIADLAVVLKRWTHRPPQAVQAIVDVSGSPAALPPAETPAEPTPAKDDSVAPPAMVLNVPALLQRSAGSYALAKRISECFLVHLPQQIAALKQSVATGDCAESARLAHRFKGASAQLGGEKAQAVAARMEIAGRQGDAQGLQALLPEFETCVTDLVQAVEQFRTAEPTDPPAAS